MARNWWIRFSLMSALVLIALLALVPSVSKVDPKSWVISKKVNLGLDLQGGLYMVLGIDFNKVYRDEIVTSTRKVQPFMQQEGMPVSLGELNIQDPRDPQQTIIVEGDVTAAKAKLLEYFGYSLRLVGEEGKNLTFALSREYLREMEATAVTRSIEVIRNRIDEFGVTEPEINSQGEDRIVVQLPGVRDIDRAKDLIGRTAKLEFRFVNDQIPDSQLNAWVEKAKAAGIVYEKGQRFSEFAEKLNTFLKADLPKGFILFFEKETSKVTNEITKMTPYLLEEVSPLGGDSLQEATVRIDQQKNRPYVAIDFKSEGAKIFGEITGANIGRRMAIVLDGNVYSAPVIQDRIAGGSAQITLGFGDYNQLLAEARDLALVLRAGALPVELEFQEQRVVGPSLGADAIQKAELAAAIGCVFVFIFIIFYYKTAGVFASITIMVNVILGLACLVALEATLTLPGIGGIALTVGMAVDGNIIIYERIKEELAKGVVPKEAVALGFDKAFWTILDANITTALAGLCLLNFGTGPVRGFAVTLLIGVVSTVYTSYFVTKLFFDWSVSRKSDAISI
ncbi:MAG: protein translocase subunit SecD [Bacteriovoracaceae bacterium]|nr:protein translocase subunit SecD [Bacteriovoracaceae bacterium]